MQCIRPILAGYSHDLNKSGDGYGITFSSKNINKELVGFSLPCRKCLPCRLNQAREKAIRCYHESKMHDDNIFLTLTYDEEHLESPKLIYKHWQDFAKKLRHECPEKKIPMMVTGEYGDLRKRPHWHALIFNYRPSDEKFKYTTDRGDRVSTSSTLEKLWQRGNIEFGDVTIDSANYVARYAAKKLVHGNDQDHDFHPIHRTSSKNAIGKSWIERNYRHTFENGFVLLPNNSKCKIPRYYVDWCRKQHPSLYLHYVTQVQPKITKEAELNKNYEDYTDQWNIDMSLYHDQPRPMLRKNVKLKILESKFEKLQEKLKL